ncbi:hypothetical protein CASFOL_012557 [Castilleja foliolosa]|uniref:Mediator-associated protein 2 n=1 Tax=Castilleja foliolosa TaxID=1961234 RepID=A0ABD3DI52_9LAMI
MDKSETSYEPPAGFLEDKKDPLIDLDLTGSTELWLIHWPMNQQPDFDDFNGQKVTVKLGGDGRMGTLEGSSGKSYDMISYKSQGPEATVFLTSASEAKIAGKISRRVSLIHYPDPSELQKRQSQRSSGATSSKSGRRHATPSRSIKPTKSTVSGYSNPSKSSKRKRDEPSKSTSHSGRDSGKGNNGVTSTGSEERKSKKKKMKV